MDMENVPVAGFQNEFVATILMLSGVIGALYAIVTKWPKLIRVFRNFKDKMVGINALRHEMKSDFHEIGLKISEFKNEVTSQLQHVIHQQNVLTSRQRALAYENPTPSFEMDDRGRFVWVNRALCLLVGKMPIELEGYGYRNILSQETREFTSDILQRGISDQRDINEVVEVTDASGKPLECIFKATRMFVPEANAGYFGTITRTI